MFFFFFVMCFSFRVKLIKLEDLERTKGLTIVNKKDVILVFEF